MIAMGLLAMIMFCCRFFLFKLYESPKYLMGRGRDEEAVRVVHEVARINGKTTNLTLADLEVFGILSFLSHDSPFHHVLGAGDFLRLVKHVF